MTTAYTSLLGLALPVTGELSGTWGDTVNNSITSLLDSAVAGTTTLSTDADVTLTTTTGAANTAREAILLCSGARTGIKTITAPAQSKIYTIINATTGGFAVKLVGVGPTTGLTIPNGASAVVAWNGSDFIEIGSASVGNFTINGNLTVTGTSTLTGAITNTAATANGVMYANGSKVLTTGTAMAFDGTNLSVGVATPQGRVHSQVTTPSTLAVSTPIYYGGDGTKQFQLLQTGATYNTAGAGGNELWYYTASYSALTFGSDGNIPIKWVSNGSEQMRLTSTGLGIGTSSPASKLDVLSTAVQPAILRSSNATGGYLALYDSANSAYRGFIGWGSGTITGAAITDLCIVPGTSGATRFGNPNGSATYAIIDSAGNLGLGVTPSAWSAASSIKAIQNPAGAFWNFSTNNVYVGQNYYWNGTNRIYLNTAEATEYNQGSGQHRWYNAPSGTAGTTATFTQAMTLDVSGNLALGNTSPQARFHSTAGATSQAGIFEAANSVALLSFVSNTTSSYTRVQLGAAGNDMVMYTTGSERARIDSSGNLGIGTSSPGVKLDVAGTIRSSSTTITGAAGGTINPTSGTTNQYTITALGAAATIDIPTGTPIDGQKLTIRIKDNGTGRGLTWTTSAGGYRVIGTTLPTTTVASKVTYVGCVYNSQDSYWDVVAVVTQA